MTALHFAADRGYASVVRALLPKLDAAGVDAVAKDGVHDGETPLAFALENKHEAVAKLLRERGAKVVGLVYSAKVVGLVYSA
eukprot:COSAG06_NODE_61889_length_266_cov_0.934132_1_plen_81_part_10